jgi:hypothetical protein
MGKGAFVTISNCSWAEVSVGYYGFDCMYEDGQEGSDFGPITSSSLEPGSELPSPGGSQYIEAKSSGPCASTPSTFVMNMHSINGSDATFHFAESNGTWKVNGGPYSRISASGVNFSVVIAHNGVSNSQDVITVVIS